jgi:hypothetical protein
MLLIINNQKVFGWLLVDHKRTTYGLFKVLPCRHIGASEIRHRSCSIRRLSFSTVMASFKLDDTILELLLFLW